MTAADPLVSVVIPAYNRASIVPRAIASVLAQTYQDWELIVVDDGSRDKTREAVEKFSDARIRLVRHQQNAGQSAARNTGIQAARGKYIAFLDSDDEWLPEKLARDVEAFEAGGDQVGLVYCGKKLVGADGQLLKVRMPTLQGDVHASLLQGDFIGSCSRVAVRRRVLEPLGGFDESLCSYEDWDLWLRVAKVSTVALVPDCLVIRHFGPQQLSGALKSILDGRMGVVTKHQTDMPASVLGRHLAVLAVMLFNYDPAKARQMTVEGLRLRPVQPVALGALLASLLGKRTYRWLFSTLTRKRHGLFVGRAAI